jgi:hypothetical protein
LEKLRKQRNEPGEELKKLTGKEADKGGSSVKAYKNDIRF